MAALLNVGRKLIGEVESLRSVCPRFGNLGEPSIDWERWFALLVTLVGDRAMRLSQPYESNGHEAHCISTVDLSSTLPAAGADEAHYEHSGVHATMIGP